MLSTWLLGQRYRSLGDFDVFLPGSGQSRSKSAFAFAAVDFAAKKRTGPGRSRWRRFIWRLYSFSVRPTCRLGIGELRLAIRRGAGRAAAARPQAGGAARSLSSWRAGGRGPASGLQSRSKGSLVDPEEGISLLHNHPLCVDLPDNARHVGPDRDVLFLGLDQACAAMTFTFVMGRVGGDDRRHLLGRLAGLGPRCRRRRNRISRAPTIGRIYLLNMIDLIPV